MLNWIRKALRHWLGVDNHAIAIDAISARLADVQQHPALSIPPLPGWEE